MVGSVSSGSMEALRPDDLPDGWASVVSKPPTRRAGGPLQDQHRHWLVFEVMDTGENTKDACDDGMIPSVDRHSDLEPFPPGLRQQAATVFRVAASQDRVASR